MASDEIRGAGVPRDEGESWEEASERIVEPEFGHCPNCGKEGQGDDVLAHNQRWCADKACPVVSFWEVADGS